MREHLGDIPSDEEIGSVIADGTYDTRNCHNAIANRGAHAVIPPRRNAKPWKPTWQAPSRATKPSRTSIGYDEDDG